MDLGSKAFYRTLAVSQLGSLTKKPVWGRNYDGMFTMHPGSRLRWPLKHQDNLFVEQLDSADRLVVHPGKEAIRDFNWEVQKAGYVGRLKYLLQSRRPSMHRNHFFVTRHNSLGRALVYSVARFFFSFFFKYVRIVFR